MRLSHLLFKTQKQPPKDETAISAQLLIQANFIQKLMAGSYIFLPLGFRVLKKIEDIVRKEMEKIGGQEILMPALQPKANWEKTGRWETYNSLFRFTSFYSQNEYVLGPTHEEIVSPLMKNFIFSYKDLPFYVFQIQTKFRDEKRVKSGLLRSREFLMKDLYSFHRDEKDLDKYYKKVTAAYFKIFSQVGLKNFTILTFAAGGTFSKYSHEFQVLTPAGEDIIYVCEKCHLAVNREIIKEQNSCPSCGNKKLKMEKAIEVGNIFKLKTKYSTPFNLKYRDENGKEKEVVMGCYGIGITRLMGAIVEVYHDKKGIIWPKNVSPYLFYLMESDRSMPHLKKFGEEIYNRLEKEGISVIYDDREKISIGEKFADADLIGLPWRLVVSPKTLKKKRIEIKARNKKQTQLIDFKEIKKYL